MRWNERYPNGELVGVVRYGPVSVSAVSKLAQSAKNHKSLTKKEIKGSLSSTSKAANAYNCRRPHDKPTSYKDVFIKQHYRRGSSLFNHNRWARDWSHSLLPNSLFYHTSHRRLISL